MSRRLLLTVAVLATLAGCDQLGLEPASVTAARVEADGKAVGAACRHGGRAIEDCFALNRRTDKAAIYAGWRDMDDYMRENKIEAVPPTLGPGAGHRTADAADSEEAASAPAGADKAADGKPGAKSDKPARGEKPVAAAKTDKADKAGHADHVTPTEGG